jgi:hypothetical protein
MPPEIYIGWYWAYRNNFRLVQLRFQSQLCGSPHDRVSTIVYQKYLDLNQTLHKPSRESRPRDPLRGI